MIRFQTTRKCKIIAGPKTKNPPVNSEADFGDDNLLEKKNYPPGQHG